MSLPRVLVLECADAKNSYYVDWRQAFLESPLIEAEVADLYELDKTYARLKKVIKDFDFIVAMYSTNAMAKNLKFLLAFTDLLQQRTCPLMVFIGNELNFPDAGDRLLDRIMVYKALQPEFIATQIPLASAKEIYTKILGDVNVVAIPHCLNPKTFFPSMPQKERPIELGMRTGKYASWLGDQERNTIVEYFQDNSAELGIKVDIDNHFMNKLPPEKWALLLGSCKGTIGNESGGFYLEHDDATVLEIKAYVYKKLGLKPNNALARWFEKRLYSYDPGRNYRNLIKLEHYLQRIKLLKYNHLLTRDSFYFYDFDEIYEKFFAPYTNALSGKCVSSRHFDAIGTQTAQILFDGEYNDILKAGEHYFSLKRDFSNVKEVVRQFKDDAFRTEMVERTYAYVMDGHTYQHRVANIVKLIP